MWNWYCNEVYDSLCYSFYSWSWEKMLYIFQKNKKFVEVHRWHVFHLGTWWRITKCFHRLSQITSPYNKVYHFCKNIFDKISFGRWYPSTRSRHDYFKTTFYQICKYYLFSNFDDRFWLNQSHKRNDFDSDTDDLINLGKTY